MKRKPTLSICALACSLALLILTAGVAVRSQSAQTTQQTVAQANEPRVEYSSVNSPSIGKDLKFAIHLPPSYDTDTKRRFPVLYFLHGMNGNEGEYQRRGVADAVERLRKEGKIGEMIVVAPAGENSFYLNSKNGVKYEDAIIKDLIPHVEKTYRAIGTATGRAIQGLSMGGYGALLLAFKHPEMFSSVTAHSSALYTELPSTSGNDRRAQFLSRLIGNIFGNPPDEEFFRANNPFYVAESNAAAIKKSGLKIYFDVGDKDRYGFQEVNKTFDERLSKAGIPHEFHIFPGNHGWEYMISVADRSYAFLWNNIKTDSKPSSAKRAGD
ncbi:MAG TPA: alpha/beta hydrolase family protein [Blastocatellia bacterium]|nr:alpha/beta hydrolase family protein [Blastocatellia bacterium]